MADIVFTNYGSGDGSGALPRLHARAYDSALTGIGAGKLPALLGSGQSGSMGRGKLPVLLGQGGVLGASIAIGRLPILKAPKGLGDAALPLLRGRASRGLTSPAIGKLPALQGMALDATLAPTASTAIGALPILQAAGVGHSTASGSASGVLPALKGIGEDASRVWGRGILPRMSGFAFAAGPIDNLLYAVQSSGYVSIEAVGTVGKRYVDGVGLATATDPEWVMVRKAVLQLAAAPPTTLLEALQTESEQLEFVDVVGVILQLLFTEGLGASATSTSWGSTVLQVRDALALLAGPGTLLDSQNAIAEALGVADKAAFVWPEQVQEVLGMHGAAPITLDGFNEVVEALGLAATPAGRATFAALVSEDVAMAGAAAVQADLVAKIEEGVAFMATFNLPDGVHVAWVLNAETRAYSSYTNFPFNSFARLGDRYYGCSDTGIYLLEGNDDDGTPIDARVRLGMETYGTSALKGAEAMYLGYRADGNMVLKVIVTGDDGALQEHWYALEARPAQEITYGRAKIGRGLRSAYWGFEIANVNGADFELDGLKWLPLVKERRVR
jgi:hypothetical protein